MRTKRGFTLIEVLVVLAVIGSIAALSVPRLLQAYQDAEAESFAQDLVGWANRIDSVRPSAFDMGGMTQQMIFDAAPPNWKGTPVGTTLPIRDAYNGDVATFIYAFSGTYNAVGIRTPNIPRSVCPRVIRLAEGRFAEVRVNGTALANVVKSSWANINLGPGAYGPACSAAYNTITWTIL